MRAVAGLLLISSLLGAGGAASYSDLKPGDEIVCFPGIASSGDGENWEIPVQGCVYEKEKRRLATALLREFVEQKGLKMSVAEERTFAERAGLFMVDHERNRKIVVRLGDQKHAAGKTTGNGQFSRVIRVPHSTIAPFLQTNREGAVTLRFSCVLKDPNRVEPSGEIRLLPSKGIMVISDIDDTIKESHVLDREALLRATFCEPFEPVIGMPELLRAWARTNSTDFCYLSASPWQLLPPLLQFAQTHQFPEGIFLLKDFRLNGKSLLALFQNPVNYKTVRIEELFRRFPERKFILLGDSGERDPEIYGAMARQHPERVLGIYVRKTPHAVNTPDRFASAFRDVTPGLWRVFETPEDLPR
jgi:phosphatidate phosphatase APP1